MKGSGALSVLCRLLLSALFYKFQIFGEPQGIKVITTMVIFMLYHELWTVLGSWKREFTVKEFSSTFASPDPNKVLHDMVRKGLLDRIGWGKYRVNSPKEYLTKKTNIASSYDLLKDARMHYALTGPDAVFFWTKGGYQADRFFGFYPIHLKVEKQDLIRWESFFVSKKQKFCVKDQPSKQTLFGVFYVLYPEVDFEVEEVNGFCVSLLEETVKFCLNNIYSYEPALEMLNEMYSLGLHVSYMEAKTNLQ